MDYTGKRVFHKAKYGEGTIVSSDSKGYIYVKYQSEDKLKKYAAPDCFKVYLLLFSLWVVSEYFCDPMDCDPLGSSAHGIS